jgi:hypothetical protein
MKIYKVFFFAMCSLIIGIGCKKTYVTNNLANKVPLANAGSNSIITLPVNNITLSGSGSDSDGHIVAYLWSQVSGPSSSTIVNPGNASTVVNGLNQGNYLFQLMVTDDGGATGVDTVSVKVNPSPLQTLTLQPSNNPNEKMLITIGSTDNSVQGGNEYVIDSWTVGGQPYTGRSIFKFDLSAIPSSATIQSANLYLYSNTPPENGNLIDANFGTNNGLVLRQITSSWTAATANWGNQPATTTTNQVLIPTTTQSVLDLNLDVKNMVASMVNTNSNFGFMLRLQNEVALNSRAFVSSYNAAKPTLRPKLVVTYVP